MTLILYDVHRDSAACNRTLIHSLVLQDSHVIDFNELMLVSNNNNNKQICIAP